MFSIRAAEINSIRENYSKNTVCVCAFVGVCTCMCVWCISLTFHLHGILGTYMYTDCTSDLQVDG